MGFNLAFKGLIPPFLTPPVSNKVTQKELLFVSFCKTPPVQTYGSKLLQSVSLCRMRYFQALCNVLVFLFEMLYCCSLSPCCKTRKNMSDGVFMGGSLSGILPNSVYKAGLSPVQCSELLTRILFFRQFGTVS